MAQRGASQIKSAVQNAKRTIFPSAAVRRRRALKQKIRLLENYETLNYA